MLVQTLVNGILLGGLYAIVGMGLAIIFGTMRIVNFAHGQWVMVGMYCSYYLFSSFNLDPYLSLPVSFGVCFLLGLLAYRLAVDRVMDAPHSTHILLMAGIGMMLTNLAQMLFNTNQRTVNLSYGHTALRVAGIQINQAYLTSFVIAVAIAAALFWFILSTETGRAIRAIAQNKNAAALMGVNVRRVTSLVFALGIGVAGAAGTLLLPMHYVDPSVGHAFSLMAFIIVVLGGMGSILGAGLGGLLIGLIGSLTAYYLGQSYSDVFTYLIFLVVLLVKPAGLLGRSRV
jgi:branched-chain amino acid transport system permease protein